MAAALSINDRDCVRNQTQSLCLSDIFLELFAGTDNEKFLSARAKAYPSRKDVKVRFHELRSYKISVLTNHGANTWAIMKMTGKKVSSDINTYLTGLDLREVFKKGEEALTLTQAANSNHGAIEELRKENMELKSKMAKVEDEIAEIKKVMEKLM